MESEKHKREKSSKIQNSESLRRGAKGGGGGGGGGDDDDEFTT
jgi:hypothetical protein